MCQGNIRTEVGSRNAEWFDFRFQGWMVIALRAWRIGQSAVGRDRGAQITAQKSEENCRNGHD